MKLTRPASMNHNDPQLGDTPTASDASSPLAPWRINSKKRRFDSAGALFHAQRGIANPSHQDSQRPLETARWPPVGHQQGRIIWARVQFTRRLIGGWRTYPFSCVTRGGS